MLYSFRKFLGGVFFLLTSLSCFGQGEIDDQSKIFYRDERSYGISVLTNGWALNYKYASRINARNKKFYEISTSHIRDSKEFKYASYDYHRGFVFGKVYSFNTLRGGYGFQREIYRKADKGGVSIRLLGSGGAILGLQKPVYYEVRHRVNNPTFQTEYNTFNNVANSNYDIVGGASFFKGVSETKINPGAYGKLGVAFEFGKQDNILHILECGISVDTYLFDMEIMANQKAQHFVSALYFSYSFGNVIDKQKIVKKKKRRTKTVEVY